MHNLPSESFNQLLIDTLIFSYFSNANGISSAFLADTIREIMSVFPLWCDGISVKMAIKSFFQNTLRYLKQSSLGCFISSRCVTVDLYPSNPQAFRMSFQPNCRTSHSLCSPVNGYIGVGWVFLHLKIEYFWKNISKIEDVTSTVTSINL